MIERCRTCVDYPECGLCDEFKESLEGKEMKCPCVDCEYFIPCGDPGNTMLAECEKKRKWVDEGIVNLMRCDSKEE